MKSTNPNIEQNFNVPFGQLQSKLENQEYDSYVLVGKKGSDTTIFASGNDSQSSQILTSANEHIRSPQTTS